MSYNVDRRELRRYYRHGFFIKQLTTTETRDGEKLIVYSPIVVGINGPYIKVFALHLLFVVTNELTNYVITAISTLTASLPPVFALFSQCDFRGSFLRLFRREFSYFFRSAVLGGCFRGDFATSTRTFFIKVMGRIYLRFAGHLRS